MSPAATMQTDNSSASLLEALRAAPTAPDAKAAADNLARHIRRNGFSCLECVDRIPLPYYH
jgi:elongation factor 3